MMGEDWDVVKRFLPSDWIDLAIQTNALKGLRKFKSADALLRTLFIHLACGYSLRETAVRARQSDLATLSDVALLKRLRKSKDWLYALCLSLFRERQLSVGKSPVPEFRLFDATTVREPGKTGSIWRIHYSIRLPSLDCDFFKITLNKGDGVGETFSQFPIAEGDYIMADAGYSKAGGVDYAHHNGAFLCFRANPHSLILFDDRGSRFPLKHRLEKMDTPGKIGSWPVVTPGLKGRQIQGRLCVVRKGEEASRIAQKKLRQKATRKGIKLKPATLFYSQYVIVFTTFPEPSFKAAEVLEWYRVRWQIELVFKRFKQIAQLGHLPKQDPESAKAWLYGKLLVALIAEKMIDYARSISPWGYPMEE